MEQAELNQPVVFEVNEALAGLKARQAPIEVEDEESEKKRIGEAEKMLPPSVTPTPKPKKALQVIVKSQEKKPEVKAMPRKPEKERYDDDEKEKKKA